MKYLQPSFTVEPPEKLDGLACPRCALGPKWGEHAKDCPKRFWDDVVRRLSNTPYMKELRRLR